MARLGMAEMDHVGILFVRPAACQYCHAWFGKAGHQTLADVVAATRDHKTVCPSWPTPRSRTAQCRAMQGQTEIPLPE